MTKLEDLMNQFYYTGKLSIDEQIDINNGLPKDDCINEYEKFFRWLNTQL